MTDYPVGTVLRDHDGDRWTKGEDGEFHCDLVGYGPWNLGELERVAGPLAVVEECTCPTVPGIDGEQIKVPSFDTVCAYCQGVRESAHPVTTWIDKHLDFEMTDWQRHILNSGKVLDFPTVFTAKVSKETVDKAKYSSGSTFPSDAFDVYEEAYNVLLRKNADYGPSNIADSPGGPLNGILVRMWDKMSRLRHLVESGVEPENESLRDSFMDMANYSLIAMIVLDGNWPGMDNDSE